MTQEEIDALLSEPRVSVFGSVTPDGRPALSPVWHLWRDGAAFVLVDRDSRKWRNAQANPNVSLCVDTKEAPYRAAIIEGTAEELEGDYVGLLREAAVHYLGEQAGNRYAERSTATPETSVIVRIVPRRIISWAY
ncbi:MAG: TIGR03618 family F420-dependent PPOX class oxidoreductase [Dehalococcoidia bacterium]|nr:TIGR03618 family F420-dependent PPOX class oxidoreductase [Dehalococcoidia bacterium]